MTQDSVPEKTNRAFYLIIIAFVLLALRIWHLMIISHDDYVTSSKRPQRKTYIEAADRGTIRDRFNKPLAVNKLLYDVSIYYDDIKEIPRVTWKREGKKKKKIYKRREYIEAFAQMLASEVGLETQHVEDLIYAKACIFPNTPFVLKKGVDENTYIKLKAMEKDWPGLKMQISSYRWYPHGKVGCNIIGYMGNINARQYLMIHHEIQKLRSTLEQREEGLLTPLPKEYRSWSEVKQRYLQLKEKSYSINAMVGKSGIESKFDEDLRGIYGKKKVEVDIRGRILRELPDSTEKVSGRRVISSISYELQEFAEQLLSENEKKRDKRFRYAGKGHGNFTSPWIKGGAIVVMDPKDGQILTLASYPRFDPNDFSKRFISDDFDQAAILKWLESDGYIAKLWEGSKPLEREFYSPKKKFYLETKFLTWEYFINSLLSLQSQVRQAIKQITTLEDAVYLLNSIEVLQVLLHSDCMPAIMDSLYPENEGHTPSVLSYDAKQCDIIAASLEKNKQAILEIKASIDTHLKMIKLNDDKILALDLLKVACPNHLFSDSLIADIGSLTLGEFWKINQKMLQHTATLKAFLKMHFHKTEFAKWRKENFKAYLKEKRLIEKEKKTYQRPYLDYLEKKEKELFEEYFKHCHLEFSKQLLLEDIKTEAITQYDSKELQNLKELLKSLSLEHIGDLLLTQRSYFDLDRPIWGRYPSLYRKHAIEQDLVRHFYPRGGFGFLKSKTYQETTTLGSIFKIVVALEAMQQKEEQGLIASNPLTIFDGARRQRIKNKGQILGYTLDRKPITRLYRGGRLPRSSHRNSGKVDLIKAFEHSSNLYFSLLASEIIESPKDIEKLAKRMSFGHKTGLELPGEVSGTLPDDLSDNKTGLYSFAIGQHTLSVTPLQTSVMLGAVASGGKVYKPQIIKTIVNVEPDSDKSLFAQAYYPFQDYLSSIGIFFPFFTETKTPHYVPYIYEVTKEENDNLLISSAIQKQLFKAMHSVVNGKEGSCRVGAIRLLYEKPKMRQRYKKNQPYLIGKTGTAEVAFKPTLDRQAKPILATHIWFGGISFKDKELQEPELIIVVYLKYGDYGKEAAPLASEIITKWREIQARHEKTTQN